MTSAPNAFLNQPAAPTDSQLAAALGLTATALWQQLLDTLFREQPKLTSEWYSYSPAKAGWSLRMKRLKRTILYVVPSAGSFRVVFIFGDKALNAIHAAGDFPQSVLDEIAAAKHYPEGTGVPVAVGSATDIETICRLVDIKIRN